MIMNLFLKLYVRVIEIVLKDHRVYKVCVDDDVKVYKLLAGLDVERWSFVCVGVLSAGEFDTLKRDRLL